MAQQPVLRHTLKRVQAIWFCRNGLQNWRTVDWPEVIAAGAVGHARLVLGYGSGHIRKLAAFRYPYGVPRPSGSEVKKKVAGP